MPESGPAVASRRIFVLKRTDDEVTHAQQQKARWCRNRAVGEIGTIDMTYDSGSRRRRGGGGGGGGYLLPVLAQNF